MAIRRRSLRNARNLRSKRTRSYGGNGTKGSKGSKGSEGSSGKKTTKVKGNKRPVRAFSQNFIKCCKKQAKSQLSIHKIHKIWSFEICQGWR